MTNEEDVSLETDHLDEVIETSPPSHPVVVIQYRNRGVPWFVVIVLLVAVPLVALAFYHRVMSRRRTYDPPLAPRQTALPVAAAGTSVAPATSDVKPNVAAAPAPAASTPPAPAVPLALNTQPLPPGSLPIVTPPSPSLTALAESIKPGGTVPAPSPEPRPGEPPGPWTEIPKPAPAQPEPKPQTPPAARSSAAPIFAIPGPRPDEDSPFADMDVARNPPPEADHQTAARPASSSPFAAPPPAVAGDLRPPPTREELLRDIKAEAAEKRQERNQLRDLKDHAREELAAEALDRTEDERVRFRRELREIIKSGSRTAGQDIQTLCDKYGSNYDPVLREKVNRQLRKLATARMTLEAKTNLLRHFGVPEAGVLDYLANEVHHFSYNSRNGPRTKDQVWFIAATQLLRTRLPKTPRGEGAGPQNDAGGRSGAAGNIQGR